MGENKKNIFMVGCPRIDLIKETISKKINKKVFENIIFSSGVGNRFDLINDDFIVVMQHPVTTEYLDAGKQIQNTLIATSKIKMKKIFFWPNVDAGSESISITIRKWREDNLDNDFYFIKNLETQHFYNLLNLSKCLVGNSSAGIRDAGYLGLPVVNIGTRQNAREHGVNVLHANNNYKDIYKKVLISTKKKYKKNYIYGDGNTAQRIVKILRNIKKIEIQKKLSYK
jgi:UDP-hydrolysing UDP-N-acetyl-D-glucosamine 2-epimerase